MNRRVRRAWWRAWAGVMAALLSILYADLTADPPPPRERPMFRVDDDPPRYPQTTDT